MDSAEESSRLMGLRVAALISGGKDSMLALHHAVWMGHEVSQLVVMLPERPDSWMFHTPNLHLTRLISEALGIPLVQAPTSGVKEVEVGDLKRILASLDVDAVVSGAVASQYQKSRIDGICKELGLTHISPLWGREPRSVLRELLDNEFEVIFVGVYAYGLGREWLGRRLDEDAVGELMELHEKFGVSPIGEGGEYETLVLDAPLYRRKIRILEVKERWMGDSGHLAILKAELTNK